MRPDRSDRPQRPGGTGGRRPVAGGGGHVARKRFGQNFLVDQGVIDEIVRAIAPKPGEALVRSEEHTSELQSH